VVVVVVVVGGRSRGWWSWPWLSWLEVVVVVVVVVVGVVVVVAAVAYECGDASCNLLRSCVGTRLRGDRHVSLHSSNVTFTHTEEYE
jgi:hypothetical protein